MPRRLDPSDPRLHVPNFPHGEMRGYRRGCSCVPCRRANAKHTAERTARRTGKPRGVSEGALVNPPEVREHLHRLLRRSTPQAIAHAAGVHPQMIRRLIADPDKHIAEVTVERIMATRPEQAASLRGRLPIGPCQRHIKTLLAEVEGATIDSIVRASGRTLGSTQLHKVYDGRRQWLHPSTALRIMALTPERVAEHVAFIDGHRTRQQVRSLQAQHWPLSELARRLGYSITRTLPFLYSDGPVTADLARRVTAVYDAIGDRHGDSPNSGEAARALGYHPAIHYDDHGHLIPGSIRDDVAARRSTTAETEARRYRNRLRIVALVVEGHANVEVVGIVGCTRKEVERRKSTDRSEGGIGLVDPADPDTLHALVADAADGIALHEPDDVFDANVDYRARWEALLAAAWPQPDDATQPGAAA